MKMHYYFFLEVNTGPHSCIWWLKYNCEAPGEGPLRGGGLWGPGGGASERPPGGLQLPSAGTDDDDDDDDDDDSL